MTHTSIILYEHIDITFLHKCTKTQITTVSSLHVIAMFVPETNPLCNFIYHVIAIYVLTTNIPIKHHVCATYTN